MSHRLYPVSDDPNMPLPVTLDRLELVVRQLGGSLEKVEGEEAAITTFDAVNFLLSFGSGGKFLSVRAIWATELNASQDLLMAIFTAADSWNREKYFPTLYNLIVDNQVEIVADFICPIECGLSDPQLLDNLAAAIATGVDAIQYMHQATQSVTG
ncbi:MAG: YbjN domain-containing protein [Actinomycetaceae bacterium]|nr:YbjN domain-containing protein [Actinomycetaceae bacterium]